MTIGTFLVGLALLAVVALVIRGMIRRKKNGSACCGCGGSCSGCPGGCAGRE